MKGLICLLVTLFVVCCDGCHTGFEDVGGTCLAFYMSTSLNWTEAEAYCKEYGGVLASVTSSSSLRAVFEYIKAYGLTESFWLGGSDASLEGDWRWLTDGSRIDKGTPYWALNSGLFGYTQEPSGGSEENCLLLDAKRHYYFNDADCSLAHHIMCMQY